jgi:proteasome lid subunit RPN8/RPN11
MHDKITIAKSVWARLITQLKKRGDNKRETGAFLLGKKGGTEIMKFICYNDLDPHAFDSGIIIFNGDGYIPLWELCARDGLKVLADVHTHPSKWTGQSSSDMRHPMIAQKGHIALIVPCYATKRNQLLQGVGVHEFLSEGKWKDWSKQPEVFEII